MRALLHVQYAPSDLSNGDTPPPPLPLLSHREVKKETFLSLADYCISTAVEMAERLDGRPMMVYRRLQSLACILRPLIVFIF